MSAIQSLRVGDQKRTDIQWIFNAFCLICRLRSVWSLKTARNLRRGSLNALGLQKPLVLGGERWEMGPSRAEQEERRKISRFEVNLKTD